jgi:hypothetical protein
MCKSERNTGQVSELSTANCIPKTAHNAIYTVLTNSPVSLKHDLPLFLTLSTFYDALKIPKKEIEGISSSSTFFYLLLLQTVSLSSFSKVNGYSKKQKKSELDKPCRDIKQAKTASMKL